MDIPAVEGVSTRPCITSAVVVSSIFCRNSWIDCPSTWPTIRAIGKDLTPKPGVIAAAWPEKPSHTNVAVGIPAFSTTALARNTAGVQAPQQPIPEITASIFKSFSSLGNAVSTACSSPPKVDPNFS